MRKLLKIHLERTQEIRNNNTSPERRIRYVANCTSLDLNQSSAPYDQGTLFLIIVHAQGYQALLDIDCEFAKFNEVELEVDTLTITIHLKARYLPYPYMSQTPLN